jgi:type IV secretory pathway VirB4 component
LNSGVNNVNIDGRKYSLTELRDQLIPSLKKEVNKEKNIGKEQRQKADTLLNTFNNQQYVVDQANLEYLRALDNFKAKKYNVTEDTLAKLKSKLEGAKEDKAMLGRQLDFYSNDLKNVASGGSVTDLPKVNIIKPGPGGYVGPAGGESTMARTFDPYEMEIRKRVVPALQQKIDKSGRTPQLDALYRLSQSGLLGK